MVEFSKIRWINANPDVDLTWDVFLDGNAFVDKLEQYSALGEQRKVLEIGPGYGRILSSTLERKLKFNSYVGVDISEKCISFLKSKFIGDNIRFLIGDVEHLNLDSKFDTVFSSLTFMHLYPSFEQALNNISTHLEKGGEVFFDLVEGTAPPHASPSDFIRSYTTEEVTSILDKVNFKLLALDHVRHTPTHILLFVVARRAHD